MGDVKPATSRAMHPAGLRGRLLLLVLRLLLFLLHDEQRGVGDARRVRSNVARFSKDRRIGRDSQSDESKYGTLRRSEASKSRQSLELGCTGSERESGVLCL